MKSLYLPLVMTNLEGGFPLNLFSGKTTVSENKKKKSLPWTKGFHMKKNISNILQTLVSMCVFIIVDSRECKINSVFDKYITLFSFFLQLHNRTSSPSACIELYSSLHWLPVQSVHNCESQLNTPTLFSLFSCSLIHIWAHISTEAHSRIYPCIQLYGVYIYTVYDLSPRYEGQLQRRNTVWQECAAFYFTVFLIRSSRVALINCLSLVIGPDVYLTIQGVIRQGIERHSV